MMRTVRTTTYIIAPGLGLSFVNFQLCPNEACAHQSEILRTLSPVAFSLWVSHFNGNRIIASHQPSLRGQLTAR